MTLEPLRTPDERARREMARREREGVRPAGPGFLYLDTEYDSRNDRRVDEIEARQKALLLLLLLATRSATSAQP